MGRSGEVDGIGSLPKTDEAINHGNGLVDSGDDDHGAEGHKVLFFPFSVRDDGIDVVGQEPENSRQSPPLLAIIGAVKPNDRDSRIAEGKAHVAEDRATIGPEGAELVVDVVPKHRGETATHLEGTPKETQLVEKVLAEVPQRISLNDQQVSDVDKVEHEEPKMARRETDRSFVAIQGQIEHGGVIITTGIKNIDEWSFHV